MLYIFCSAGEPARIPRQILGLSQESHTKQFCYVPERTFAPNGNANTVHMAMERHSGNCCGSAGAGAVAGTAPAGGPSTSRNPGSYSALLLWTLGRVQASVCGVLKFINISSTLLCRCLTTVAHIYLWLSWHSGQIRTSA